MSTIKPLQEFRSVQFRIVEDIHESKDKPWLMTIEGKIGEADTINDNGNLYPREIYEPEVEAMNKRLAYGDGLGQDAHPGFFSSPSFGETAVIWQKVWMDGREAFGRGVVPPTTAGMNVAAIIACHGRVCVSSRGWGEGAKKTMDADHPKFDFNREHDGEDFTEIQPGYELETYDLVTRPGVRDADIRSAEDQPRAGALDHYTGKTPTQVMQLFEAAIAAKETDMATKEQLKELQDKFDAKEKEFADFKTGVEANSEELKESFGEELANARAEAATNAMSDEDRALLDRVKALTPEQLETALKPPAVETYPGEVDETKRELLAMKLQLDEEKKRNDELAETVKKMADEGKAKDEKLALERKVDELIADKPKDLQPELRKHLLEDAACKTAEEAEAELGRITKFLKIRAAAEGLEPGNGQGKGLAVDTTGYTEGSLGSQLDKTAKQYEDAWAAEMGGTPDENTQTD